jgi:hydrogenase/urease accessory protein HupE
MPDFLAEFLLRLGVMLPVILIVVAAIWFALKTRGGVKQGVPIDPADMRTWSLGFALADAAVFALIYALVSAWIGQGDWSAAVAGGVSAVVALGVFPRLAARFT